MQSTDPERMAFMLRAVRRAYRVMGTSPPSCCSLCIARWEECALTLLAALVTDEALYGGDPVPQLGKSEPCR